MSLSVKLQDTSRTKDEDNAAVWHSTVAGMTAC